MPLTLFIDAQNRLCDYKLRLRMRSRLLDTKRTTRNLYLNPAYFFCGHRWRVVSCDRWACTGLQSQLVMDHIEAFILAGGASSRMGSDKSQLLINDHSFIEHIADTLFNVTNSVTIVGHHSDDTRLQVAMDVYPKWGALGGIHGALNACQTEWAFVVACDMPFVSSELIQLLARPILNENRQEAVVPIQPDGRPQPLCAFYRLDPCLPRATQLIESGHRRPLALLIRLQHAGFPLQNWKIWINHKTFLLTSTRQRTIMRQLRGQRPTSPKLPPSTS